MSCWKSSETLFAGALRSIQAASQTKVSEGLACRRDRRSSTVAVAESPEQVRSKEVQPAQRSLGAGNGKEPNGPLEPRLGCPKIT